MDYTISLGHYYFGQLGHYHFGVTLFKNLFDISVHGARIVLLLK